MNSNQLAGILRAIIPGLAGYLAGKGIFFDADTWNVIMGGLATALVAGWSAKVHTNSGDDTLAIPNATGSIAGESDDPPAHALPNYHR